MNKTILIYSGGLDSTVLLYKLLNDDHETKCISFFYGQKHLKEIESAKHFTSKFKLEHEIIDISNISHLLSKSSLISGNNIPDGLYNKESMTHTVVPNRNMIMLSIASAWAMNLKYNFISYAAHNSDYTIYPDCRPEFVNNLNETLKISDWNKVELYTPFIKNKKAEIVSIGNDLRVDFKKTWSCYNGEQKHCGRCGTCLERINAFKLANIKDETIYE